MKRRHHSINQFGFSITEMLLVVGLFSVLSIAVYQTFSNGLKIWDYGTKFFAEEDVFIFLEKISEDLQNTLKHSSIEFKGEDNFVEFATIVTVLRDSPGSPKDAYVRQIGKTRYYLNNEKHSIMVKKANYAKAIRGKYFKPQRVTPHVQSLKFRYYFKTDQGLKAKRKD